MSDNLNEFDNVDNLSPDEFINNKIAGKSDTEIQLELAKLELELKKQELILKQQQLDDMKLDREYKKFDLLVKQDQANIIQGRRTAQVEANRQKMDALISFMSNREAQQNHCNHRKGGTDARSIIYGEGTSDMRSIIRHGLPSGNFMAICTRCNKEWHPPRPFNVENGVLKPLPATEGWLEMVNAPTDNTASASSNFTFQKS